MCVRTRIRVFFVFPSLFDSSSSSFSASLFLLLLPAFLTQLCVQREECVSYIKGVPENSRFPLSIVSNAALDLGTFDPGMAVEALDLANSQILAAPRVSGRKAYPLVTASFIRSAGNRPLELGENDGVLRYTYGMKAAFWFCICEMTLRLAKVEFGISIHLRLAPHSFGAKLAK